MAIRRISEPASPAGSWGYGTYHRQDSLETQPCVCYRQLYLEKLYQVSNILDDGMTGFKYWMKASMMTNRQKRHGSDISPRDQIMAIRTVPAFIENFMDPVSPLYFYGAVGTGKTFWQNPQA